jgi:hypothetical protein
MQVRRSTKLRIDGLSCLLAEQVLPHERLLWRGCPDPHGSAAARVYLYRYGGILTVARWRVMSLGAVLATLVFFNMRDSLPPTDVTTTSAGVAAFFTFYLTILACEVAYWVVQMARAGDICWPAWRWWPGRGLLRLPVPLGWQATTNPLIEPPAAAIRTNRVIYGLTDQRVIVLVDGRRRSIRSYWLHEITDVRCIDARDGWGDLALVVEEGAPDFEEDEPPYSSEWEEVRLWGIARAGCVADALRCLIARQPLRAAIAALSYGGASVEEPRGPGRGDGLPRGALPRARMWQATLWHGSSETQLAPCIVYGSSLVELRRQAASQLISLRPHCFSNGPAPASQNARHMPRRKPALYLFSLPGSGEEQTSPSTGASTPPSPQKEQARQRAAWRRVAQDSDGNAPRDFMQFEDAVEYFVSHDALPEKGPDYEDLLLAQGNQWLYAQTVRVVDDAELANDLLCRGGWHIFAAMGMTAPRGTKGPVLFVLGHPENRAV